MINRARAFAARVSDRRCSLSGTLFVVRGHRRPLFGRYPAQSLLRLPHGCPHAAVGERRGPPTRTHSFSRPSQTYEPRSTRSVRSARYSFFAFVSTRSATTRPHPSPAECPHTARVSRRDGGPGRVHVLRSSLPFESAVAVSSGGHLGAAVRRRGASPAPNSAPKDVTQSTNPSTSPPRRVALGCLKLSQIRPSRWRVTVHPATCRG